MSSPLILTPSLSSAQAALIESDAEITALICGLGYGKSVGMGWATTVRAQRGELVLGTAPTASMLSDVLVRETIGVMNANHIRHRHLKTPYNSIAVGAGEILYRSGFDADKTRGINADTVAMDEAVYLKNRASFDTIFARSGRGPKQRRALIIGTTPKGRQNYLYDVLHDENGIIRPGVRIIGGSSLDSPFLSNEYKRGLIRQYVPGTPWFRQEVLGEWVSWAGGFIEANKIICGFRPNIVRTCRAWDTASSEKKSADYTASCLLGISADGRVHILDVTQWRDVYGKIKPRIIERMKGDPRGTVQVIEDTQAGQVIRSDLLTSGELGGIAIMPIDPINDKITRSMAFASRVAAGMVTMESASWNRPYQDELSAFGPKCDHDDMVDATAHAYNFLTNTQPAQSFRGNF